MTGPRNRTLTMTIAVPVDAPDADADTIASAILMTYSSAILRAITEGKMPKHMARGLLDPSPLSAFFMDTWEEAPPVPEMTLRERVAQIKTLAQEKLGDVLEGEIRRDP